MFLGVTLLVSWTLGAIWLQDERRFLLIRLACAWAFQRETPRAAGFAFTRASHWALSGLGLPLLYMVVLLALAYCLLRPLLGADFIHYTPEAVVEGQVIWRRN